METTLESADRGRKRVYSPRNRLRRDMVTGNPIYELFVSGSSTGSATMFHCMICQRDVSMESRGAAEFSRHFFGKRHWLLDVTYRVQNGLPVFNRLMDPMVLSDAQLEEYRNRPNKGKNEGFSFPEDLLPACVQANSSVPLMSMVNCLIELLRFGGSYLLLRKLWGCFRATLGPENPLYNVHWSRPESLVSKSKCPADWCLLSVRGGVCTESAQSHLLHRASCVGRKFCVLVADLPSLVPSCVAFLARSNWCFPRVQYFFHGERWVPQVFRANL